MNLPPTGDDWFPLEELNLRLAQLVWVEEAVAGVLDTWAGIESHAGATRAHAVAAAHHRWHAQVLGELLATSPALDASSAVGPPTPGWSQAIETLIELADPSRTATRLRVLLREINPWLARETGALLDLARPIADAELARWLRFIEIDHHDDGAGLGVMLEALIGNTESLEDRALLASVDLRSRPPAPSPQD